MNFVAFKVIIHQRIYQSYISCRRDDFSIMQHCIKGSANIFEKSCNLLHLLNTENAQVQVSENG
ncbi:14518_t:CDS:2 [Funneliformis mosseae]|uniref:14518_t:CDS:1 n=1 Tax=Funneliformis mosseae TaxID=27381 RepID=A0A9N8WNL4_FUNMO|nr:14518_t:CDS:2 [Funneliformis mosseae]